VVRPGPGLGAEHGHLGFGEPVGDQAAVDRSSDRTRGLADDDDLGGVGILLGEVVERRRAVDIAAVLDGQVRRVSVGGVAQMRVTGARAHIEERVVGERVVGLGDVEHPVPVLRLRRLIAPVVEVALAAVAGEGAAVRVPADAAAVQEEHDPGGIRPPFPEGEPAAVGAAAVTGRHHGRPLQTPRGAAAGQHDEQRGQQETRTAAAGDGRRHAAQAARRRTGRAPICGQVPDHDFRRVSSGDAGA
jgi:hypothetical protein